MPLALFAICLAVPAQMLYRRVTAVDDTGVEVFNQTAIMKPQDDQWVPVDLIWVGTTRMTIDAQNQEKARLLRRPNLDPSRLPWPLQGDFLYWITDDLGRAHWSDLFERLDTAPLGQMVVFKPTSPLGTTFNTRRVATKGDDAVDIDGKYHFDVEESFKTRTQSGQLSGQFKFKQGTHILTAWALTWHTDSYDRTPALNLRDSGGLYTPDASGLPPP